MSPHDFYQKHTRLTRSLKEFISEQQRNFSEDIFENFLDSLSEELRRIKALLFEVPAGPMRAKNVQALVDLESSQETDISASCTKGCSHCCHLEVEITNYEATILNEIIAGGFRIDRDQLARQRQRPLLDPAWRNLQLKAQNRCVFLDPNNACGIYEDRPVMCRRHSVTSAPKHCETHDEMITLRYFPRVDLILSAANEDPELRVGPLAKMIVSD
jgi:Fe-S-cluster containining protein